MTNATAIVEKRLYFHGAADDEVMLSKLLAWSVQKRAKSFTASDHDVVVEIIESENVFLT